ncbi:MAG: hypothetical protein QOE13_1170 [Gaiellaceae bacterium]|jgi:uncharacterized protein YcnI|nr:hypothetical protein [Gaiellaceae bacterium]
MTQARAQPGRLARVLAVLIAAASAAAITATKAEAHAIVRPSESRPAELQQYALTVPTERGVPTVSVALKVPAGIDFFVVQETAGWRTKLVRVNGRIDQVRWTGGSIAPGFFATFRFIARNPIMAGAISWRIVQQYGDGKAVRWIGPAESDTPAATTAINEQATPVDVVSGLNGGRPASISASGGSSAENGTVAADSSGGRDALTLGLAIAAVVLSIVAGAAALRPKRRSVA